SCMVILKLYQLRRIEVIIDVVRESSELLIIGGLCKVGEVLGKNGAVPFFDDDIVECESVTAFTVVEARKSNTESYLRSRLWEHCEGMFAHGPFALIGDGPTRRYSLLIARIGGYCQAVVPLQS